MNKSFESPCAEASVALANNFFSDPANPSTVHPGDPVVFPEVTVAPESPSLRERFIRSRIGRMALGGLAALGLASGGVAMEASPAFADNSPVYTVVNPDNDGTRRIYDRNSPSWGDSTRTAPDFSFYGDRLELICGTNGEAVGPHNNTRWHFAKNIYRPEAGTTWIPDRYLNTPNKANQPTPGEKECGETQQAQQSGETITSIPYNRTAAANWAKNHAQDTPAYDASCTWFVSNALWAGGLPEGKEWNNDGGHGHLNWRPGTAAAWEARSFIDYIRKIYPQSSYDKIDFAQNTVPKAEHGDVIAYDWENDGRIDHLAFVTDIVGTQYPEVAEWSPLPDGKLASLYVERGWTWSEISHKWIQEKTHDRAAAYLLHIDTTQLGKF